MHSSTQPQGVGGHHGTPGAPPHEQVCWTYLNSLPGYADGTSPSNWLNDKGVARPGCFLRKPITHTCAFRRARKTAPDVVKGSPNPGCSLERKLSENVTLTPLLPRKEQGQGRSLNTGSTVRHLPSLDLVPQHDQASGGQESYLLLGCILRLPKAKISSCCW